MKQNRYPKLFVAADYLLLELSRHGVNKVYERAMELGEKLSGYPVGFKMNTLLRVFSYSVIDTIHSFNLKFFADLKIVDIEKTLENDGVFLSVYKPEFLTVAVQCVSSSALTTLCRSAGETTEVLGFLLPSDMSDEEIERRCKCSPREMVLRLSREAALSGLDGVIASARWIEWIRSDPTLNHLKIVTPAIRPAWAQVRRDGQIKARSVTPAEAIRLGADAIVCGAPVVEADDPLLAALRILEEINRELETLNTRGI